MYSTVALVREISGFNSETKIASSRIAGKISVADSMINGALAYRYILPIAKHSQNTITFSGTASASGTASITINGVAYTFSITSGQTAATICDSFRTSLLSNDYFITDPLGSGSTVTIISRSTNATTSREQVTIGATSSVTGVTITAGTVMYRFPPALTYISADIATALLLQEEYGKEGEGTSRDGFVRMEACVETLKELQGTAKVVLRIYDEVTLEELPQAEEENIRCFPNNAGNDSTTNNTSPFITMNGIL